MGSNVAPGVLEPACPGGCWAWGSGPGERLGVLGAGRPGLGLGLPSGLGAVPKPWPGQGVGWGPGAWETEGVNPGPGNRLTSATVPPEQNSME